MARVASLPVCSVTEAALHLGISTATIHRLVKAGKLKAGHTSPSGGRVLISRKAIEEFLNDSEERAGF
ncbi:MAG: helix-turn-helix domain-containing protein [Ferrimicrobium sp.]